MWHYLASVSSRSFENDRTCSEIDLHYYITCRRYYVAVFHSSEEHPGKYNWYSYTMSIHFGMTRHTIIIILAYSINQVHDYFISLLNTAIFMIRFRADQHPQSNYYDVTDDSQRRLGLATESHVYQTGLINGRQRNATITFV